MICVFLNMRYKRVICTHLTMTIPLLRYMAPEVLLGSTNYSTPIDMWAAGCVMAELLTGKPLLPGSDTADMMKKICYVIGTLTKVHINISNNIVNRFWSFTCQTGKNNVHR